VIGALMLFEATVTAADTAAPPQTFREQIEELTGARQLIVATADDWNTSRAQIALYERSNDGPWRAVGSPFKAAMGRRGMAWGIGVHGTSPKGASLKRERDGRSPAGVFELEQIYGFASMNDAKLQFPYTQLSERFEGIDDPKSRYYNRLIDTSRAGVKDWTHSEKVRLTNESFRWCINVKHNWKPYPSYGSCIYLHIWRREGVPTVGCTAMSRENIETLVHWLDAAKHPLLVQLPRAEYARLRRAWQLP
jgi:L,D-peptidoglycan transpeptidase YkuD (ErfK/YbiS/YcfS/YnhG family)